MKSFYTDRVPFELAKELELCKYPQCRKEDNWAGVKYTMDGELTSAPYANHYAAPTYAEAIDWLMRKNIFISIYYVNESKKWSADFETKRSVHFLVAKDTDWHSAANTVIKEALIKSGQYPVIIDD